MSEEKEYSLITVLSNDKNLIEDGEVFLRFKNWRIFKRLLTGWMDVDLDTTLKRLRYKRSLAQNRFIWGICVPVVRLWIKETTGEKLSKDETYIHLNMNVLGNKPVIKQVAGEEIIVMTGKRFSQMTTKEFSDAVEVIVQYYAPKGLVIPLPKDGTNNILDDFLTDN